MKPTRKHNIKRKYGCTHKNIKKRGGVYKSLKESFVNATIENLDTKTPCKNFEINMNAPINYKKTIYPVKCNQDENYVMKMNVTKEEADIQSELSQHDITLPISKLIHAGGNNYHIIMPKYKDTLEDRLKNFKLSKNQIDKVIEHINKYIYSLPADIRDIIRARGDNYLKQNQSQPYTTQSEWNKFMEHTFNSIAPSHINPHLRLDLEQDQQDFLINTLEHAVLLVHKMHRLGVIHHDTQPKNFMFDNADKLYAIDFGRSYKIYECNDLRTNPDLLKKTIDSDLLTVLYHLRPSYSFSDNYTCGKSSIILDTTDILDAMIEQIISKKLPENYATLKQTPPFKNKARYKKCSNALMGEQPSPY
jgi:serine/threonine protein kinase